MSDATYHAAILPSRPMNNPNTGKLWNAATDYWWEKPRESENSLKMYGLRNARADHNRILFFPESSGVLVCWVNVQEHFDVPKYVNNREYKTFAEARHLWECLNHSDRTGMEWIRDDSVPPRMVEPKHPGSGWGKPPIYSASYKSKTNYALEA